MIMLLLACVGTSKGQQYTDLSGNYFQNFEVIFGDSYDKAFDIPEGATIKDNYQNDLSIDKTKFGVMIKQLGNKVYKYEDLKKIPPCPLDNDQNIVPYNFILVYYDDYGNWHQIAGYGNPGSYDYYEGMTFKVKPRPLYLRIKEDVHFDYESEDKQEYDVSSEGFEYEFYSIEKEDEENKEVNGLADFDKTTELDFENTKFVFVDGKASWNEKLADVNWAIKKNDTKEDLEDKDKVDWTKYYEIVTPIQRNAYIDFVCPNEIEWKTKEGTTISDNVEIQYGKTLGVKDVENCVPQYFDIYPVLKGVDDCDNSTFMVNAFLPELTYTFGGDDKKYNDGYKLSVGSYTFKAVFKNHDGLEIGCESAPITVNITKQKVDATPNIIKKKGYNGTTDVKSNDGFECVIPNTGLHVPYTAEYNDANAGKNKEIVVIFGAIEGTGKENYELKNTQLTITDGEITPVSPKVVWKYLDEDCKDQTKQSILYGESVSNVTASLDFDTQEQDSKYQKSYEATYLLNGKSFDDKTELDPTKTYTLSVTYVYKGEEANPDNKNLKIAKGSIKIKATSLQIQLVWSGTDKNKLEYGDAKVADGLSYNAVNKLEQSKISYEYYLSSDLNISDANLFKAANKVQTGFAPKIGKYKFGCIATDKNGYMESCTIAEEIEIKKSSKLYKIDLPEIECEKKYDGNWIAKVVKPAKYQDIEFETKAYFVDGDVDMSQKQLDEKDFRSDASMLYSVFYQFVVPKEVSDVYNLYINSDKDNDGNITYNQYTSGDFVYYKPGQILCVKPEVEVVVPDKAVYGDCTLGGENETDVRVYTKYKNEIVAIEGEWSFNDYRRHLAYEAGTNTLTVGGYEFVADIVSHNDNFCDASEEFVLSIVPRPLTIEGDLLISDKYEDGTDIIERSAVVVPTVKGILPIDNGKVTVNWDYSNTKYPSAAVKYADEAETIVDAYDNIPVGVSISGKSAFNYQLTSKVVYGSSKILPFEFTYNIASEDVKTYRLMYGKSVLGVDLQLTNQLEEGQYVRYMVDGLYDHTLMMQPPKQNPEDFYYIDVQIVEGGRYADAQKDEVKILTRQKIKLYVDKYKLVVSEPNIEHQKKYDGNTSVKWVNGNNCVITNAVAGDGIALDGEPVIAYDTPDVGKNKTITVTFNLKGDNLYRYILPDGYVYTDGVITRLADVDKMVVQSVTPDVLPSDGGYCSGDDIVVNVVFQEGEPDKCNLIFYDNAKKVGFLDEYNIELQHVGDGTYSLSFKCPNATYGTYKAYLQFVDPEDGRTKDSEPFEFVVNYSSDYLQSKYKNVGYDGDVLVIKNLDLDYFVEYQWYKTPFEDNEPAELRGETKQFLYETPYLYGKYSATMVTVDGNKVKVCPKWFGPKERPRSKSSVEKSVAVYPNPAFSMEDVTIKLIGFDEESCNNANIFIYNSMGSIVKTLNNVDELNTVNLPSGNYSGVVVFDGKKIPFKFIVRN